MKYCKYCGTEMSDDAQFCPNCGKSANDEKDVNNNSSKKSRAAAAVLAWFLGNIGIHRLYVGKIRSGILMLIFGIISTLLFFVFVGSGGFSISTIGGFSTSTYTLNGSNVNVNIFSNLFSGVLIVAFVLALVITNLIRIIDFIRILIGNFKDGTGEELINW